MVEEAEGACAEEAPAELRGADSAGAAMPSRRARNAVVYAFVAATWLALDLATKAFFSDALSDGGSVESPLPQLFEFALVHNTGGAWGLFGGSTLPLAIVSVIVVAALTLYLFVSAPQAGAWQAVGVGLVVAGGIGNAVDRFTLGYVVDFIDLSLFDFPVFNIADIGVTCGLAVFFLALLHEGGVVGQRGRR